MQLRDYLPIFRKRWPLILGIVAVAVVASYLFSRLQTPIYRATVYLTVSPSRVDLGQTLSIENLLRQYARQLQTDRIAEDVNQRLNLDLAVERMRAKARVAAVSDELLLSMEIDDTDPNRARDIAFAWADEYVKFHQNKMAAVDPRDRIEVELLDKPAPAVLNWPKRNQIMAAAAIVGLIVGVLLAFVLEFLDDTLKSADDVDRFVKLPVLAAVPPGDGAAGRVEVRNGHRRSTAVPGIPITRR